MLTCNKDFLDSHFYIIVKLGCVDVYSVSFSSSFCSSDRCLKHRLWVLFRTAITSTRKHGLPAHAMFTSEQHARVIQTPLNPTSIQQTGMYMGIRILSSSELHDSQGELKVYPCSAVRPLSSVHDSKTTLPIKANFHAEPP